MGRTSCTEPQYLYKGALYLLSQFSCPYRIPVGGEIFGTCPDRPRGPHGLMYNGYRVFPGGKERPGRDAESSLPSSAVVMKE